MLQRGLSAIAEHLVTTGVAYSKFALPLPVPLPIIVSGHFRFFCEVGILYYATEAAHTQYNHTQSIKQ